MDAGWALRPLSGTLYIPRTSGDLRPAPHRDDPNDPSPPAIEKPIRTYNDLAVRKIGELRDRSPGFRELQEPFQRHFYATAEADGGVGLVLPDKRESGKKLSTGGRRENDRHCSVFCQKRISFR